MKAIERKWRILPNGNIQLDEPIDAPVGEVRLVILFPEDIRQEIPQKLSPEERMRILTVLDRVAELSLKEGPPVSNREHDQYLYGGGNWKGWSFTDCTSKVIMERLNISTAFSFDEHFEQFGSVIRVP